MINFFEKEKVTDPNFWIVMYITGASQTTELDSEMPAIFTLWMEILWNSKLYIVIIRDTFTVVFN